MAEVAMEVAAVDENDDSWLYGSGGAEPREPRDAEDAPEPEEEAEKEVQPDVEKEAEPDAETETETEAEAKSEREMEPGEIDDSHFDKDESESESSEDDVKVILGDVKSYAHLNIKRSGTTLARSDALQHKQANKFGADEFDAVGTINGVPAHDFNLDALEDKPWRKPGADLTDYFNYGFDEDTWRLYCERQKRMRVHESGSGLVPLAPPHLHPISSQPRHPTPINNDNSKYSVAFGAARKAGPPPGRKLTGPIDVIGGRHDDPDKPPNNTIQVMTADRREYSRTKPFPDMSLPPPPPDFYPPPPSYSAYPEDSWAANKPGWAPSDIKELTPGPMAVPPGMPPMGMGPPPVGNGPYGPPHHSYHRDDRSSVHRDRDKDDDRDDHESEMRDRRERDRDRDRSRSGKPESRSREGHRRERSRSRSRRHKSRSRSPSSRHRSKKKSSHRKDKEDSD